MTLTYKDTNIGKNGIVELEDVESDFWEKNYEINNEENKFYMWIGNDKETVFITKTKNVTEYPLVKKILEEFKGAKIETIVRKNLEKLAEEEINLDETIVINNFDDEE